MNELPTSDNKELEFLIAIKETMLALPADCRSRNWTDFLHEITVRIRQLKEYLA